MNIAFAGFRHSHIFSLYKMAKESSEVTVVGCFERDNDAREAASRELLAEFNFSWPSNILLYIYTTHS